ncbi:MAG: NAD(P)/FAD-dependent oxidoreductase [Bacillota bacterium]|nr:NAD(P)/FAD-dependent oxidoreductase [Bacillota bacterium]MDW7684520.1 NAD(P)/FAD-dependent oxidoreductase [Bacillota bacterium]
MAQKVIIIGGGIAGLSSGCYAQLNGYESEIYEMHNLPGGLCTAWHRKGYTFDGCIHWLVGSKSDTAMHRVWRTIGALAGQPLHHHDEFVRITDSDGRTVIQYTDLDRLERHLLDVSPADEDVIRELIEGARTLVKLEMPVGKPRELFGPLDGLKMMWEMRPYLKVFMKYSKISVGEFAARFKDPLLRNMLTAVLDPRYNMIAFLATMGSLAAKDAGWPQGGSLAFARAAEKRYLELGGRIHYNSKVRKILVEDNRAAGVELADGRQVRADAVISAADGYTTLYKLLGAEYVPDKIAKYYSGDYPTMTSMMVYMGIDYDLSGIPHSTVFPLDPPLEIAGQVHSYIGFKNYSFDPNMSPPGKCVVASVFHTDSDYWQELAKNREKYDTQKARIARRVMDELEKRFPETVGRVEVTDVATPATFTRYTGVWQGAYMSWISTPKSGNIMIPQRLQGLRDFYMAGLWTMGSAGLPGSAVSGRSAIQIICAEQNKQFAADL